MKSKINPKGAQAARLRKKKYELIQQFKLPEDIIGGSFVLSHGKCGKPNCHCAKGEGHPRWSLTFMVKGKKKVEQIPKDWVEQIKPLIERGNEYKAAVSELLSINAQLLSLWRKQKSKLRYGRKK